MVEAVTIFFVLSFIVFISCFFMKVYNVLNFENRSGLPESIMILIVGIASYSVGLFTILSDLSTLTYIIMFRFETLFIIIFLILFIIELFILYKDVVLGKGIYDRTGGER